MKINKRQGEIVELVDSEKQVTVKELSVVMR